jgi:hypothetical protein
MFSRIRDRIAKLEEQIPPKRRVFVFFSVEEPDLPPYAEQLAAFKAEHSIASSDLIHEVTVTFA